MSTSSVSSGPADASSVSQTKPSAASSYPFFAQLARMINSGQARSIIISGNVNDLFFDGEQYVPIVPYLLHKTRVSGIIHVVYELNGPIRLNNDDRERLREAWAAWKTGLDAYSLALKELTSDSAKIEMRRKEFDQYLREAIGNSTQALEFMRQLAICSRVSLQQNLLIFIEAADMLLPAGDGDVSKMSDTLMRRVAIVTDWFSDPEFFSGPDTVCLLCESRSLIHPRVSRLPQVLSVDVPAPDLSARAHFIRWQMHQPSSATLPVPESGTTGSTEVADSSDHWLAEATAGLSLHALRQLLLAAAYNQRPVSRSDVVAQVEEFIQAQLGDDVVEFKKPAHTLKGVVGFAKLKEFLAE